MRIRTPLEFLHPAVRPAIREWLEKGKTYEEDLPIYPGWTVLFSATPDRRLAKVHGTDNYIDPKSWTEDALAETVVERGRSGRESKGT